jgi:beta-glucosidase-like glycosyl hydrolase
MLKLENIEKDKQEHDALDQSVYRILETSFKIGLFDYPSNASFGNNVTTPETK